MKKKLPRLGSKLDRVYADLISVPMTQVIRKLVEFGYDFDGSDADIYNFLPTVFVVGNKIRRDLKVVRSKCFTKMISDNTVVFAYFGGTISRGTVELGCTITLGHPRFTRLLEVLQRSQATKEISIIWPKDLFGGYIYDNFNRDESEEQILLKSAKFIEQIVSYLSPVRESTINIGTIFQEIDSWLIFKKGKPENVQAYEVASLLLQERYEEVELLLIQIKDYHVDLARFSSDGSTIHTYDEVYRNSFRSFEAEQRPNDTFIDEEFLDLALEICKARKLPS